MAKVVKLGGSAETGGSSGPGGAPKKQESAKAGPAFEFTPPVMIGGGVALVAVIAVGLFLAFGRGGGSSSIETPAGPAAPTAAAPMDSGPAAADPAGQATGMTPAASSGGAAMGGMAGPGMPGVGPGMPAVGSGGAAASGVPFGSDLPGAPNMSGGAGGGASVTTTRISGPGTETVGPGGKSIGTSSAGQPVNPNDPPDDFRRR